MVKNKRKEAVMSKFIPTYHALNLYVVPPQFFKDQGVKTLVLDLDNTLASHKDMVASKETKAYIESLKSLGIRVFIVSNNKGPRVKSYASSVGLKYIAGARKPLTSKIRKFLKKEGASLNEVMMVGDQLLTDVFCANRLGVKILLTDKLVESDQWTTKINRIFDRPLRKRLKRKNKLKEWNDNDGR